MVEVGNSGSVVCTLRGTITWTTISCCTTKLMPKSNRFRVSETQPWGERGIRFLFPLQSQTRPAPPKQTFSELSCSAGPDDRWKDDFSGDFTRLVSGYMCVLPRGGNSEPVCVIQRRPCLLCHHPQAPTWADVSIAPVLRAGTVTNQSAPHPALFNLLLSSFWLAKNKHMSQFVNICVIESVIEKTKPKRNAVINILH